MQTKSLKAKLLSGLLSVTILLSISPMVSAEDKNPTEPPQTMSERIDLLLAEKTNAPVQAQSVQQGNVYIPRGTTFEVELVKDANSKTNKKGEIVEIRMVDNLMINGIVVIAKDTIGEALISEARKAGGFGRKGKLTITPLKIKTINNIVVPLDANLKGAGSTDGGAVAVAAFVSLVGGIFMKGSNITYAAGTNIKVAVDKDVDLNATPQNLAEVMNPAKPQGTNLIIMVK